MLIIAAQSEETLAPTRGPGSPRRRAASKLGAVVDVDHRGLR